MAKIKITEKPLVQNPPEDYNLLVSYDIDDMESLRRIPVSALKGDLDEKIDVESIAQAFTPGYYDAGALCTYEGKLWQSKSSQEASSFIYNLWNPRSVESWVSEIQATTDSVESGLFDTQTAVQGLQTDLESVERQIEDLRYEPIAINTFTMSPATVEKGSTVQSINFAYTLNKTPKTLKLDSETLTPNSTSYQKTGLSVTSDTTYTLTATDDGSYSNPPKTVTKTATLRFYDKIHYGVATVPSTYNNDFLLTGLSNHDLASSKAKTFTVNATSGKFIFFALPTSMGTPNFNVGGFDGGFTKVAEFSHRNDSGYTTTYAVYKSDNAGLGTTKVTIS